MTRSLQISSQLVSAGLEQLPGLAIACYLLQKGANPKLKNAQKCTPLDALASIGQVQENKTHVLQILQRYTKYVTESHSLCDEC